MKLTLTVLACSEGGVLGNLLIYTRECILASDLPGKETLKTLSERYMDAALVLQLPRVPSIFMEKHGIITSAHYRTLAEVIEVIICDVIPPTSVLGRVIHATVTWYWACRAATFTEATLVDLQAKTQELHDAWAALDTPEWRATLRARPPKGVFVPQRSVLLTPKFHRAVHHTVDYVRRFGPIQDLTTETSEAMHKPLKIIFRTLVIGCFMVFCFVLYCCARLVRCWWVVQFHTITRNFRSNKQNASKIIARRLTRMLKVNIAVAGRDADYADDAAEDDEDADDTVADAAAEGAAHGVNLEEPAASFKHGQGTWMTVDEMLEHVLPDGAQYRGALFVCCWFCKQCRFAT